MVQDVDNPVLAEICDEFEAGMHWDPERARGNCFNESRRFVAALDMNGIEGEVISGVRTQHNVVLNGHAAVRVGDMVYDWTARQFYPHDQPVPLVQTYEEWREDWPSL